MAAMVEADRSSTHGSTTLAIAPDGLIAHIMLSMVVFPRAAMAMQHGLAMWTIISGILAVEYLYYRPATLATRVSTAARWPCVAALGLSRASRRGVGRPLAFAPRNE